MRRALLLAVLLGTAAYGQSQPRNCNVEVPNYEMGTLDCSREWTACGCSEYIQWEPVCDDIPKLSYWVVERRDPGLFKPWVRVATVDYGDGVDCRTGPEPAGRVSVRKGLLPNGMMAHYVALDSPSPVPGRQYRYRVRSARWAQEREWLSAPSDIVRYRGAALMVLP